MNDKRTSTIAITSAAGASKTALSEVHDGDGIHTRPHAYPHFNLQHDVLLQNCREIAPALANSRSFCYDVYMRSVKLQRVQNNHGNAALRMYMWDTLSACSYILMKRRGMFVKFAAHTCPERTLTDVEDDSVRENVKLTEPRAEHGKQINNQ